MSPSTSVVVRVIAVAVSAGVVTTCASTSGASLTDVIVRLGVAAAAVRHRGSDRPAGRRQRALGLRLSEKTAKPAGLRGCDQKTAIVWLMATSV